METTTGGDKRIDSAKLQRELAERGVSPEVSQEIADKIVLAGGAGLSQQQLVEAIKAATLDDCALAFDEVGAFSSEDETFIAGMLVGESPSLRTVVLTNPDSVFDLARGLLLSRGSVPSVLIATSSRPATAYFIGPLIRMLILIWKAFQAWRKARKAIAAARAAERAHRAGRLSRAAAVAAKLCGIL